MRKSILLLGFSMMALGVALLAYPAMATDSEGGESYGQASQESAEAVAAIAETGIKTVVGVAAIPVGAAGSASAATGYSAQELGDSVAASGVQTVEAAGAAVDFATSPLTVTNTVVLTAQPSPSVPYDAKPK